MTSGKPTRAIGETTETPPNSGDSGSVTLLNSDDPVSQTLSLRPVQDPATDSTPVVIRPEDVSDMSLTEAAYWIATEGGSRDGYINDTEMWELAFDQLLKEIIDDKIAVLGRKFDSGLHEHVPWSHFLDVKISYPYCGQPSDFVTGNEPHLQCWGIFDGEHRRNGFNDKLFQRRLDIAWSDLRVRSADIAEHWSYVKTSKSRSGRRPKYDWPDMKRYVFEMMEKSGDFHDTNLDDDGWHQADLERLAQRYWNDAPGEATIRRYVAKFATEWRAQSRKAHNKL
jgi:hypothetical protein